MKKRRRCLQKPSEGGRRGGQMVLVSTREWKILPFRANSADLGCQKEGEGGAGR